MKNNLEPHWKNNSTNIMTITTALALAYYAPKHFAFSDNWALLSFGSVCLAFITYAVLSHILLRASNVQALAVAVVMSITLLYVISHKSSLPGDQRAGQAVVCQDRLRVLGSALESYSVNSGNYPPSLQLLVPGYIDSIPSCPAGKPYRYQRTVIYHKTMCSEFTISCESGQHSDQPGHPQYSSVGGLAPR